jgi:hypothetical protein
MGECSANNVAGADNSAALPRVGTWIAGFAVVGAIAGSIVAAVAGVVTAAALAIVAEAAAAGAALGYFIGQAVDWFTRLKTQSPDTITMKGVVMCVGKNPFGIQPWSDGDWTMNIGDMTFVAPPNLPVTTPGALDQVDEVRTRPASGSGLAHAFKSCNVPPPPGQDHCAPGQDILHCEISSHIGSYSVVGGAVGAVAGGVLGGALGAALAAAICAALGVVTFGIAALICALIVILAFVIAGIVAGGFLGNLIGAGIGAIVDAVTDFDQAGDNVENGCLLFVTGRWVTDTSHQHNEIHDINSITIVECGVGTSAQGLTFSGAVGTGRHPAGKDP